MVAGCRRNAGAAAAFSFQSHNFDAASAIVRSLIPSALSMMRAMMNRVALAAVAFAFCVAAIPPPAVAQVGASELLVRIERLENQVRQLTGQIEQMQYRNQQLEAALQELTARGAPPRPAAARPTLAQPAQPPASPPPPSGRRSDAFDPTENPNAPGAPRVLGSISANPAGGFPPRNDGGTPTIMADDPPRAVGAPLDLTGGAAAGGEPPPGRVMPGPAASPLPPPRAPGSTGPYAVANAPASSPREVFDLGNGYLQRKDFVLAEETFRDFLKRYPSDRLAGEAQYGLGESLFQRQNYVDAANAFVALSKKYETSARAPDALLRLGQSLAAIEQKELACVAFGDIGRKYPRASQSVKQTVDREQKRLRC
jgi:tol-pal system protein YbgF